MLPSGSKWCCFNRVRFRLRFALLTAACGAIALPSGWSSAAEEAASGGKSPTASASASVTSADGKSVTVTIKSGETTTVTSDTNADATNADAAKTDNSTASKDGKAKATAKSKSDAQAARKAKAEAAAAIRAERLAQFRQRGKTTSTANTNGVNFQNDPFNSRSVSPFGNNNNSSGLNAALNGLSVINQQGGNASASASASSSSGGRGASFAGGKGGAGGGGSSSASSAAASSGGASSASASASAGGEDEKCKKDGKGNQQDTPKSKPTTTTTSDGTTQHADLNEAILQFASEHLGQQVGNGECWTLAAEAMAAAGAAPPKLYDFGDEVALDEIVPGNILQFEEAYFRGVDYYLQMGAPHHTAIVVSVDRSKVTLLNQNVNGSKVVMYSVINLLELKSGSITAYAAQPGRSGRVTAE